MESLAPGRSRERWSADFVSGQLANARRFRVLDLVDDFSRECVLQLVGRSISGQRMAREVERLAHRLPRTKVCDNRPEFTRKAMFFWARETVVKLHFIQPGKPTQKAFFESFNVQVPGVLSQPALVRQYRGRPSDHRRMAHPLQSCPAPWITAPEATCRDRQRDGLIRTSSHIPGGLNQGGTVSLVGVRDRPGEYPPRVDDQG